MLGGMGGISTISKITKLLDRGNFSSLKNCFIFVSNANEQRLYSRKGLDFL